MILQQCTKDFNGLIERLNLLKAYEDAEEGHEEWAHGGSDLRRIIPKSDG